NGRLFALERLLDDRRPSAVLVTIDRELIGVFVGKFADRTPLGRWANERLELEDHMVAVQTHRPLVDPLAAVLIQIVDGFLVLVPTECGLNGRLVRPSLVKDADATHGGLVEGPVVAKLDTELWIVVAPDATDHRSHFGERRVERFLWSGLVLRQR